MPMDLAQQRNWEYLTRNGLHIPGMNSRLQQAILEAYSELRHLEALQRAVKRLIDVIHDADITYPQSVREHAKLVAKMLEYCPGHQWYTPAGVDYAGDDTMWCVWCGVRRDKAPCPPPSST